MVEQTGSAARRTKTGQVVSDKMDKTVVVAVEVLRKHPLYGRSVRRTRRYKAHDPANQARTGDRVVIAETRPMSREKRWRVVSIVGRKEAPVALAEEIES